jgi:SOS-response transcriptional repressor LexA
MVWTPSRPKKEECEGKCVTPVQKEMYVLIDEFWKRFGFGPTYRELALLRGTTIGNAKKLVDRLVQLGVIKRVAKMDRSVRPSYMSFRKGEFDE